MALKKYKLASDGLGDDHVFVLGNTKFLKNLNDDEAGVLFRNGDKRIIDAAEESIQKKVKSIINAVTHE